MFGTPVRQYSELFGSPFNRERKGLKTAGFPWIRIRFASIAATEWPSSRADPGNEREGTGREKSLISPSLLTSRQLAPADGPRRLAERSVLAGTGLVPTRTPYAGAGRESEGSAGLGIRRIGGRVVFKKQGSRRRSFHGVDFGGRSACCRGQTGPWICHGPHYGRPPQRRFDS